MTEQEFCRWLKGFVELSEVSMISEKQWNVIKDHLNLVYTKLTPVYSPVPMPHKEFKPWPIPKYTPKDFRDLPSVDYKFIC